MEASPQRVRALDALRGFDMFWIVGGSSILGAWAEQSDQAWLHWAHAQTEHVAWNGFAFWDLIFPLFLFLAGASLPFSFAKRRAAGASERELAHHALRRGLVLVVLGMVYNGLLRFDFATLRCASVLGRIGLAWMCAAWIAMRTSSMRTRIAWIAALLVGYWLALSVIPVPGFGPANLEPGTNLTDWIDQHLLPGVLHRGVRDPEGLFGTVPAIATALLGVVAGEMLRNEAQSGRGKVVALALAAAPCFLIGALWALVFPLNKNLWSSSFVLWCAGWSFAALSLAYLLCDVWRLGRGPFFCEVIGFFEVLGANAITIYLLSNFVDFDALAELLLSGRGALRLHPALVAGGGLGLRWLVLFGMYRGRVFLRV